MENKEELIRMVKLVPFITANDHAEKIIDLIESHLQQQWLERAKGIIESFRLTSGDFGLINIDETIDKLEQEFKDER